jgi:hypothetical protein
VTAIAFGKGIGVNDISHVAEMSARAKRIHLNSRVNESGFETWQAKKSIDSKKKGHGIIPRPLLKTEVVS